MTVTGSQEAEQLYDARRGVYYAKPALRGWLHLLCFGLSLVGGALLLARAHSASQITAAAIYSASLSALFGTSALYHRGTWTGAESRKAGVAVPEFVAGVVFIGLGCAGGLAMPWVWLHDGAVSGGLLLAGGLLYIAGALSYHRRWPDPYPSVFGYHEVFHVYVCAAAACQYAAIARLAG